MMSITANHFIGNNVVSRILTTLLSKKWSVVRRLEQQTFFTLLSRVRRKLGEKTADLGANKCTLLRCDPSSKYFWKRSSAFAKHVY